MKLPARTAAAMLTVTLAAGLGTPLAQAAPDTERRAAFRPTLQASKAEVISGKRLILTGKVKPARKGTKVVLQKRTGDTWRTEKRLTTNARGVFRYTDRPHTAGFRKYRVVVPASGKTGRGLSKPITVGVYAWQSLKKLPNRSDNYTFWHSVTFGGTAFDPAVSGKYTGSGYMDWNVFNKCIRLTARFGNNDEANLGSVANVSVLEDGVSGFAKSYGVGQSSVQTVDIRNAFRIAFSWTSTSGGAPTDGGRATMAVPMVLCAM